MRSDSITLAALIAATTSLALGSSSLAGSSVCDASIRVQDGQAAPQGGAFSLDTPTSPATVNGDGTVAFFAEVAGQPASPGIFTASSTGAGAVVLGCAAAGEAGVCGDPSPVGGTFSRLFPGTAFAPDINDHGDVLFLAEVVNGDAPRGLFLRDGATGAYHVVAAVGDPAPTGGTFDEIGIGSLNNLGAVVFLARAGGDSDADIFHWVGGTLAAVAEVGDPGACAADLDGDGHVGVSDLLALLGAWG